MSNQIENQKNSDIIYEMGNVKITVRRENEQEFVEIEPKKIPMKEIVAIISILQTLRQERNIPFFLFGGG